MALFLAMLFCFACLVAVAVDFGRALVSAQDRDQQARERFAKRDGGRH